MKRSYDFSFRYLVWGVYFDRDPNIIRIYPIPCFRITLDWTA